ncbi:hypothetical protein SRB5_59980 [Streptomyces sp. RB5]|uniref:Uncharacterized protein n=1 Tax=Streptomyces smaragdinus TaxID=2585196 RepID=A0A7K0CQP5_9ACTN|nr:FG-GAP-like repeat-containing protein [Streptomyces smaragdinus]MQY15807.1 hypothetical protein [Streptomyces smaragdinus]
MSFSVGLRRRGGLLLAGVLAAAASLLPVGVANAQDTGEECAPLAVAGFGDPGAAVARGTLEPDEADCFTVTAEAGRHVLRLTGSYEMSATVDGLSGEPGCYAQRNTTGWCELPESRAYTVHITSRDFQAAPYEFAITSLDGTDGCHAADTAWDSPAVEITPATELQVDCSTIPGSAGERLDSFATSEAARRIVDPSGAEVCVRDDGDGCVLQGDGPFRVISYDDSPYTLRVGSLSDPRGCATVRAGSYGTAPAGSTTTNRCRMLSLPDAGRYAVGPADAAVDSEYWSVVYDADGRKLCPSGIAWCDLPSAEGSFMLLRDPYFDRAGTVLVPAAGTAGCEQAGAGTYRGEIGNPGEWDCLELSMGPGARIAAVRDYDAETEPNYEVIDGSGATVCYEENLRYGTCALTGAAPHKLISHGGLGEYGLWVARTDTPADCEPLPAGTFADGSPYATFTTGAGVFAGCGSIPAEHASREVLQFRAMSGTAVMSFSVIDGNGKQVCQHSGGTQGWTGCALTPGQAHTIVYQGRNSAASYQVTRRDITATAQGCATNPATAVGGPSTGGPIGDPGTLVCRKVTTADARDVLHLNARDSLGAANVVAFDSAGVGRCDANRSCAVTGSTSYQVLVTVPSYLKSPGSYRFDAMRIATEAGPVAECPRVPSISYGFGPLTGTLDEQHTAVCASLATDYNDRFNTDITDTAGGTEKAVPALYDESLDNGCYNSMPGGYQCYISEPFGSVASPSILVLGLPEKVSQTDYRADFLCTSEPCGTEKLTVKSVTPTTAAAGTKATVTVSGTALPDDAHVQLYSNGTTIVGTTVSISPDRTKLTGELDLTNAAAGSWSVSLVRPGYQYGLGSFEVTQAALVNVARPTLKGFAQVGTKLTAQPGTWPAGPTSYTYQWKANGTAISGATAATYTVPASLRGKSLSVAVTAHKAGWQSATAESAAAVVMTARRDHLVLDGYGDMLTLNTKGELTFHPATGKGGFATTGKVSGAGWATTVKAVPFGDVNGDRCNDVLVRSGDTLKVYKPACGKAVTPTTANTSLGTGWSKYNLFTSPGDLTSDGRADLLARQASTGDIYLFAATSDGKLAAGKKIRTGWAAYNLMAGAGDLNGDGHGDLLTRHTDGTLYWYAGLGNGQFKERVKIFSGWGGSYTSLVGPGDITGDGKADLVVRDKNGVLYRNNGDGKGSFSSKTQLVTGWTYVALF